MYEIDLRKPQLTRWKEVAEREAESIDFMSLQLLKKAESTLRGQIISNAAYIFGERHYVEIASMAYFAGIPLKQLLLLNLWNELSHINKLILPTKIPNIQNEIKIDNGTAESVLRIPFKPGSIIYCKFLRPDGQKFHSACVPGQTGVLNGCLENKYIIHTALTENIAMNIKSVGVPILIRKILEEVDTYEEALSVLKNTKLRTPAIFMIAGPDKSTKIERLCSYQFTNNEKTTTSAFSHPRLARYNKRENKTSMNEGIKIIDKVV